MLGTLFDKEEKYAKKLLKKYPFIKKMWQEREKVFDEAHKKEVLIEKKYNKIAQKVGLRSVKFAYNEYCFGIDVNDVDAHGTNLKENRLLIHDMTLEEK
jgi:hypothetical protein